MTTRRWLLLALAVVAVLLVVGRELAGVYSDYLWYDALGARALWRTRFMAVLALRLGSGVAAGLFAFANLYAVRQSVLSLVFPRRLGNLEIGEEVPSRYLVGAALVLSAILGSVLTIPGSNWTTLVLARSGRSFAELDPYFGSDLGFFVYWLPLENVLWTWAFFTVVVVSVAVVILYALTPSLKWQRTSVYASTYVRRHFTVLIGVLLLLLAWGFRLDMYSLVMEGSGPDAAFGFVDFRVGIPGDVLLALATLGSALIVVWAGLAGQIRLAGVSVITVVALALIVREIAPAIVQHTGSDAERAARERPYYAVRAGYTRRAYGVDAIMVADSSLAFPTMAGALPWVPLWDTPAVSRAVDGSRDDADPGALIAWRWTPAGVAGDLVMAPPAGSASRVPWTVTRFLGAGSDERGAPLRLSTAHTGAVDDSPLEPPLVFPGSGSFAIIPDSLKNSSGSPLDSPVVRLANAWALQSFRIISGELPEPRPTLVTHRDVRERLDRFMPFFAQGRDVQPLLVGDTLFWAVDLYSVSDTYPLSRHAMLLGDERSYMHHAAVGVVHASSGDVTVVPDSALDPIAASWVRRLPSLFGSWNELPAGLRAQVTAPSDMLYAEAAAYGRYGSRTDSAAPLHLPALDGSDTSLTGADLPIILPNTKTPSLVVPMVDESDRVRGLLIGTGGAKKLSAWYPLATPGPRWSSVIDRLRSVDTVSAANRESALAHGRIRAVPLRTGGGIGFIQPSYSWHPATIPALNQVALLVGDSTRSIAAGALGSVTPTAGVPPPPGASPASLYDAMRAAMRRGDWTAFGRAFDALGRALGRRSGP